MTAADEARAEAGRQEDEQWKASLSDYEDAGYGSPAADWERMFWDAGYKRGAVVGAEWQASRTPEAAPSDTDLADLILALRGNPANARGRWPNVKECAAAADALERLATSQPVQVEVTDEQVEAAVEYLKEYYEVRSSHGNLRWIVPDEEVRAALEAAKGVQS